MPRLIAASIAFLALWVVSPGAQSSSALPQWNRIANGALAGFLESPTEHVIDAVGTITVRRVKGSVRSAAGPWPDDAVVVFELRGPGSSTNVHGVRLRNDGGLDLALAAEGAYRFKATAAGWQSVTGIVVVSAVAREDAIVSIVLPLGV